MTLKGIDFSFSSVPELDKGFIPLAKFNEVFLKTAKQPLAIALERSDNRVAVFDTFIHGTAELFEADCYYVERIIKVLLWVKGGFKVTVFGDEKVAEYIKSTYSQNGQRAFDFVTMAKIYERNFEVHAKPYSQKVEPNEKSEPLGRHLDGCRIGFDAGGSDRKVSAVVDGEAVFSEEVVWFPKTNSEPDYHYQGIVEAFKSAAAKMPRVDAIGISSAGVYIDNRTMIASLFLKVSEADFNAKVKDIYIRAAKEIGDIPVVVANDGDVTALAGAMDLEDNSVLGIAMGTSQAGGYVDGLGNITGWLNELAFVPIDGQKDAALDEWAGDIGCGVKYFSQDGVIKLAPAAEIELDAGLSPAEKLKVVQGKMEHGEKGAVDIYKTIGTYLGHAVAQYTEHYEIKHVLLLGRVMSGEGGNIILKEANATLSADYPAIYNSLKLHLPDEKSRRVGQSVAAASLPAIKK